jgi:putative RecB family exonuclease
VSDIRSYSQLSSYDRCPYMYYLERVEKVWQKPAAWLPMGSAVHEAAEAWELSGRTMELEAAILVFENAYQRETNKYLAETPNPNFWFRSGPYKGPEDIVRRYNLGREHVERYIRWYMEKHPEETPVIITAGEDAGKMLVEMPFVIELGGVKVRGFIDYVGFDAKDRVIVRDNKTGNTPGGPEQLATYALAVEAKYPGLGPVDTGDFFMTRTGKPTIPYQLTRRVKKQVVEDFVRMDEAVKAGDFPAKPEASKCMFCSVRGSCKFRV